MKGRISAQQIISGSAGKYLNSQPSDKMPDCRKNMKLIIAVNCCKHLTRLRYNLLVILSLLAPPVLATSVWHLQPQQSTLIFIGKQNNAPVSGKFTAYSANIIFDPQQLSSSKIEFDVDINSVSTSYAAIAQTLKTAEWFNVQLFPHATFKSNLIEKVTEKNYRAKGVLTIRDKTQPIAVDFILKDYSDQKAQISGNFNIQRTAFGVGQGEWASTDNVQDEVKIIFEFILSKT